MDGMNTNQPKQQEPWEAVNLGETVLPSKNEDTSGLENLENLDLNAAPKEIAKIEFGMTEPISLDINTNIGTYIMKWIGGDSFEVVFSDNRDGKTYNITMNCPDINSTLYDEVKDIIKKQVTKYIKKKFNDVQKTIAEKRAQEYNKQPNDINDLDNSAMSEYMSNPNINPNTLNLNNNSFPQGVYNSLQKKQERKPQINIGKSILKYIMNK